MSNRPVETVAAWFEKHPDIELISRDRSSEYATVALMGIEDMVHSALVGGMSMGVPFIIQCGNFLPFHASS
jgi:hypothetical protein